MERIDEFELLRELGRGGMGVVYEARHPQLDRAVALKVFNLDAASPDALLRFEREAQLLARVRHPNVVTIHTSGRSERGPYLVTELVEGDDLGTLLRKGPLEPARAARLVSLVAAGVSALHAEGVVHRDLKPDNVVLTPGGEPKLLDFGLARDASAERLTQTGSLVGTPAYMAPEQAEAKTTETPDPRTDVYGLGAILFTLLSGQPPFSGGSLLKLLSRVVSEPPRWPPGVEATLPPALKATCERAMAKTPDARQPSAEVLRSELEGYLAGSAPSGGGSLAPRVLAGVALVAGVVSLVTLAALGPAPPDASVTPPPDPDLASEASAPKPLTVPEIVAGRRDLEAALPLAPEPRLRTLTEWLRRNPRHPKLAEARRAQRRARLAVPLASVQHYLPGQYLDDRRVRVLMLSDGRLLTWGRDTTLRLWSLRAPGTPVWAAPSVAQGKGLATEAPGGGEVLVGAARGVHRVELTSGRSTMLPLLGAPDARSLAFALDGTRLVLSSQPRGVAIYAWPSLKLLHEFDVESLRALAVDPSGRYVAGTPSQSNAIEARAEPLKLHVFDVERGAVRCQIPLAAPTAGVAFPDPSHVIVGNAAGEILVYDCTQPQAAPRPLRGIADPRESAPPSDVSAFAPEIAAHTSGLVGLALSPDRRTLYSASDARGLVLRFHQQPSTRRSVHKIWTYPEGKELLAVPRRLIDVYSLHVNGDRLAVGDADGVAQVFVAGRP